MPSWCAEGQSYLCLLRKLVIADWWMEAMKAVPRLGNFMRVLTSNVLKVIKPGVRVRAGICIASNTEASVDQSIMWLTTERLGFKYRQGNYGFCFCKIGFRGRVHRRACFWKRYLLSLLMIISGDSETSRDGSVGIVTKLRAEWRRN